MLQNDRQRTVASNESFPFEKAAPHPQGSKTIDLPQGIPMVTFADATKEDLAGGATVLVPATKAEDGALSTKLVVVGTGNVVPPM